MSNQKQCPHCGASLSRANARYCRHCGRPLPAASAGSARPAAGLRGRHYATLAAVLALAVFAIVLWRLNPWQLDPPPTATPPIVTGEATESPTPAEASPNPTATPVPSPSDTPDHTATPLPTHTDEPTPTPTLTWTPTSSPTMTPSPSPTPVPPRRIAYVSEESGSPQIWLVNADGGSRRQLTSSGSNFIPSWSPDNHYIYYVSQRNGSKSIARFDLAAGHEDIIESGGGYDRLTILPSGELASVRNAGGQYSLNVGSRTIFSLGRRFDFHVSPDQTQFLIDPLVDPRMLYTVDISSGQIREVAGIKSWNGSWSPDGRLLFVSDRVGTAFLYVAAREGRNASIIGPTDKWSQSPSWSPDAGWITYVAGDGSAWNLYRIAGDGSNRRRMAEKVNPNKSPIWEPDSRRVAFESDRYGDLDIFTVDMASGQVRQLTTSNANDYDPVWSH